MMETIKDKAERVYHILQKEGKILNSEIKVRCGISDDEFEEVMEYVEKNYNVESYNDHNNFRFK